MAMMNEDLHSWFQGLNYEEGFMPDKVPPYEMKKKQIETYAILSQPRCEERDFWWRRGPVVFPLFWHVWLRFADNMEKLQFFYDLANS